MKVCVHFVAAAMLLVLASIAASAFWDRVLVPSVLLSTTKEPPPCVPHISATCTTFHIDSMQDSTTDVPYFKKLEFPPVSIFHTLNAAHRGFGVTLSSIRNIVYLIHHAHCRHPDYFFAMNMIVSSRI